MRRPLTPVLAASLAAGALLTSCGSGDDDEAGPSPTSAAPTTAPTTPAAGTGPTVHELRGLSGNRWSTPELAIAAGDKVHVTNADQDRAHNAVVEGVGTSPTMNPGDEFTLTFAKAGSYELVCTFHPGMEMTVTVG